MRQLRAGRINTLQADDEIYAKKGLDIAMGLVSASDADCCGIQCAIGGGKITINCYCTSGIIQHGGKIPGRIRTASLLIGRGQRVIVTRQLRGVQSYILGAALFTKNVVAQARSLARVNRHPAAEIGQGEGGLAIAAISGA